MYERLTYGKNAFGVEVPSSGRSLWFVSPKLQGWMNCGNTCFVNASLQWLLRLQPFYKALHNHHEKCERKVCMLCYSWEEAKFLRSPRATGRVSTLAVAARLGSFGDDYKGRIVRTSSRQVPTANAFPSRECDAHDFMCSYITTIEDAEKLSLIHI